MRIRTRMHGCERIHMATKNTTIRLDKEMIEEIDQSCRDGECTRNDWMKDAASEKLQREKAQDQEVIEDVKSEPKPTVELIEEPKSAIELIPEIKEPKVIVEEVPQDNSNKPVVQFTNFNGKLLPVARRFNT